MMNKQNSEEIMDMVFQIGRQMRHQLKDSSEDQKKPVDKTSPYQTFALSSLAHGATTSSELAEEMGITLPSATSLVDRLVKNGWVTREPDPNDRRIIRLGVTDQGMAVCVMMKKKRLKAFNVLIDAMTEDDQQALYRILKNVYATLEQQKGE